MTLGSSIFLTAVGAILYFALDIAKVAGINISTIVVILMIAGIVGVVLSLFYTNRTRRVVRVDTLRDREVLD